MGEAKRRQDQARPVVKIVHPPSQTSVGPPTPPPDPDDARQTGALARFVDWAKGWFKGARR